MNTNKKTPERSPLLSLLFLAFIGLFLSLGGWVRAASRAALPGATTRAIASANPTLVAVPGAVATHAPAAPPTPAGPSMRDPGLPTARAFLADYYGTRWPEVERAIAAWGVDLDQPYSFTPWEDVQLEFERVFPLEKEDERRGAAQPMLDWPEPLSAGWIAENYGVDPATLHEADLEALSALASGHNLELAGVAEEWVRGIDLHLRERWEDGQYFKAPFTTMGLYQERGFFSTTSVGYGWGVSVALKRAEYPDMVAIEERAESLRDQRDELVLGYLAAPR